MIRENFLRLSVLIVLISFCTISYSQSTDNRRERPVKAERVFHESLDLLKYKDFLWFNCDNVEKYLTQDNVIYLVVHWNNFQKYGEQTIDKIQEIKKENKSLKIVIVYNTLNEVERNYAHFRHHLLSNNVELPVVVIQDEQFVNSLKIENYPTSIMYSPRYGIIKKYNDLASLDQVTDDYKVERKKPINSDLIRFGENFHKLSDDYTEPVISHLSDIENYSEKDWLFVSQPSKHRILITDLEGKILNVLGHGVYGDNNGLPSYAKFNHPQGMYWNTERQSLYVADTYNNCIRKVDFYLDITKSIFVETDNSILHNPADIAVLNEDLYVVMEESGEIWKMNMDTEEFVPLKAVTGGKLSLDSPTSITVDENGFLYVVERYTGRIAKISLSDNSKTYLDTDFIATKVEFGDSKLMVTSAYSDKVLVFENDKLQISIGGKKADYKDGKFKDVLFYEPNGITFMNGQAHVVDAGNNMIRSIDLEKERVSVISYYDVKPLADVVHRRPVYSVDLETVYINPEFNQFNIELEEGDFVLERKTATNVLLIGDFPAIIDIEDMYLNDGKAVFTMEGKDNKALIEVVVHATYYEDTYPRKYFKKTVLYRIPLLIEGNAAAAHDIIIPLIDSKE